MPKRAPAKSERPKVKKRVYTQEQKKRKLERKKELREEKEREHAEIVELYESLQVTHKETLRQLRYYKRKCERLEEKLKKKQTEAALAE